MLIDTHFHLDLMENMQTLIRDLRVSDVGVIAVGTTPKAYQREIDFCRGVKNIRVGLGLHPQLVKERAEELDQLIELIPSTRYIGEVGLDYNSSFVCSKDKQLQCFRKIVKSCAKQGNKIISIHSVKAAGTVIDELEQAGAFRSCICILHWFTGTANERSLAINNGAFFSINPRMLSTKNGKETIKAIPSESILLETDAPFTKKFNSAEDLKLELEHLAHEISDIRNEDIRNTVEFTSMRVFGE